jgi:hypothetical protein
VSCEIRCIDASSIGRPGCVPSHLIPPRRGGWRLIPWSCGLSGVGVAGPSKRVWVSGRGVCIGSSLRTSGQRESNWPPKPELGKYSQASRVSRDSQLPSFHLDGRYLLYLTEERLVRNDATRWKGRPCGAKARQALTRLEQQKSTCTCTCSGRVQTDRPRLLFSVPVTLPSQPLFLSHVPPCTTKLPVVPHDLFFSLFFFSSSIF